MTTKTNEISNPVEDMYCSLVSNENKEDPIGTAAKHERYFFIEVPLPWTSKVEDSKHFPEGLAERMTELAEEGRKCRLQAFISEEAVSPPGYTRIMYYERPAPSFAFYDRREYVVPNSEILSFAEAIIMGSESLAQFDDYAEEEKEVRDLFVCTHGSRDRCCGKFGFPTYHAIKEHYTSEKIRVWRTSHMGGHRHAPTMIDLPEGRFWAQMTPDLLDTLILRKGPFAHIARNYRGWGGVSPFEQAVEREAFIQEGWDWIEYEKQATMEKSDDETSAFVKINYRSADGVTSGTYEAQVSATSTVQIGGCGKDLSETKQYEVSQLTKK